MTERTRQSSLLVSTALLERTQTTSRGRRDRGRGLGKGRARELPTCAVKARHPSGTETYSATRKPPGPRRPQPPRLHRIGVADSTTGHMTDLSLQPPRLPRRSGGEAESSDFYPQGCFLSTPHQRTLTHGPMAFVTNITRRCCHSRSPKGVRRSAPESGTV